MIVVSDNFDFVIDDQYITISILLKYKPRKRYPFYAGLKIKQTFDSVRHNNSSVSTLNCMKSLQTFFKMLVLVHFCFRYFVVLTVKVLNALLFFCDL